ncbi:MAG: nucleotidyl transferase AbiEii/AbiGii toxin family protein [Candidatus Eremiobacterota bacterium]
MVELSTFLRLGQALEGEGVAYVLVGGLALFAQGLPRVTYDIDLFIDPTEDNVERLKAALRSVYHDPCIEEILPDDLCGEEGGVIRYGPPEGDYVIDILGRLGEAWTYADLEAQWIDVQGVRWRVATPRTLYRMKRGTVRPQDQADAAALQLKFALEDD